MRPSDPTRPWSGWIFPGGGIEPGEDAFSALSRELFEELGVSGFSLGAPIWTRFNRFEWEGAILEQAEVFHLVRTDKFDPDPANQIVGPETRAFRGFRWWSIGEIESSAETFVPRRTAELLRTLIEEGVPDPPFDAGR